MKCETNTRDNARQLVDEFHIQVREDDLLGPVFLLALGDDWSLEKLTMFWCTIELSTRSFQGDVYGTHMQLNDIEPEQFQRWLSLFERKANSLFEEEQANQFITMARRVASSLQIDFFSPIIHSQGCVAG